MLLVLSKFLNFCRDYNLAPVKYRHNTLKFSFISFFFFTCRSKTLRRSLCRCMHIKMSHRVPGSRTQKFFFRHRGRKKRVVIGQLKFRTFSRENFYEHLSSFILRQFACKMQYGLALLSFFSLSLSLSSLVRSIVASPRVTCLMIETSVFPLARVRYLRSRRCTDGRGPSFEPVSIYR